VHDDTDLVSVSSRVPEYGHAWGDRVECKIPFLSGRKWDHLVNFSTAGRVLFKYWCMVHKNLIFSTHTQKYEIIECCEK